MKYDNVYKGIFIKRLNRFLAEVIIDKNKEMVHVRNTGRCKEVLIEGREVFVEKANNPLRKTRYSLISAYKADKLINIDSSIPNNVVFEAIRDKKIKYFFDLANVVREKKYNNSRFDIYYKRKNNAEGFIEIKGVTLEENKIAMFPDAPTERGRKHLSQMMDAVKNGYEGNIFFLIQMDYVKKFRPNRVTDKKFGEALDECIASGVNIHIYNSTVKEDSITLKEKGFLYEVNQ